MDIFILLSDVMFMVYFVYNSYGGGGGGSRRIGCWIIVKPYKLTSYLRT